MTFILTFCLCLIHFLLGATGTYLSMRPKRERKAIATVQLPKVNELWFYEGAEYKIVGTYDATDVALVKSTMGPYLYCERKSLKDFIAKGFLMTPEARARLKRQEKIKQAEEDERQRARDEAQRWFQNHGIADY